MFRVGRIWAGRDQRACCRGHCGGTCLVLRAAVGHSPDAGETVTPPLGVSHRSSWGGTGGLRLSPQPLFLWGPCDLFGQLSRCGDREGDVHSPFFSHWCYCQDTLLPTLSLPRPWDPCPPPGGPTFPSPAASPVWSPLEVEPLDLTTMLLPHDSHMLSMPDVGQVGPPGRQEDSSPR